MKIYTRTGDKGTTSLYGGKRVKKDSLRIAAYGTIDELNCALGFLISHLETGKEIKKILIKIQHDLLTIGSSLALGKVDLGGIEERVSQMEEMIDKLEKELPSLKNFIIPGGTKVASLTHLVRAISRRAERKIVSLLDEGQRVDGRVLQYLNRLSDLMFMLARYLNKEAGKKEAIWKNHT